VETPEPVKGWLKGTADDWQALWADPLAAAYRPTDVEALCRLFSLRDDRERFRRAVRKAPLVTGSTGQTVLNPLARQMSTLDAEIRQLEDRFGLTPAARLRLGITLADAARTRAELEKEVDVDRFKGIC
jgi:P27 family predicted phage terminase small subunit